eukprot:29268-Pelagococcus_subviridis.AAC.2
MRRRLLLALPAGQEQNSGHRGRDDALQRADGEPRDVLGGRAAVTGVGARRRHVGLEDRALRGRAGWTLKGNGANASVSRASHRSHGGQPVNGVHHADGVVRGPVYGTTRLEHHAVVAQGFEHRGEDALRDRRGRLHVVRAVGQDLRLHDRDEARVSVRAHAQIARLAARSVDRQHRAPLREPRASGVVPRAPRVEAVQTLRRGLAVETAVERHHARVHLDADEDALRGCERKKRIESVISRNKACRDQTSPKYQTLKPRAVGEKRQRSFVSSERE